MNIAEIWENLTKRFVSTIFLAAFLHSAGIGLIAQIETLNNQKVIDMIKLGLSEQLIVAKISKSRCDCDTSTAAIAKLKAARVTDAIIMAMIEHSGSNYSESSPSPVRPHDKAAESSSTPRADSAALRQMSEPGIYLFDDGKATQIEPTVFSGTKANFLKGALTYGIMKSKFKAKIRQSSANLKAGSTPVFYFVFSSEYRNSGATMAGGWYGMPATSPAEFVMVQMAVKDASREAIIGEYGAFSGVSTGTRDKDIREYAFEKIKTGVYKVTPKTTLSPGEYCFYYAGNVTGLGLAGGKVFDFSVK